MKQGGVKKERKKRKKKKENWKKKWTSQAIILIMILIEAQTKAIEAGQIFLLQFDGMWGRDRLQTGQTHMWDKRYRGERRGLYLTGFSDNQDNNKTRNGASY